MKHRKEKEGEAVRRPLRGYIGGSLRGALAVLLALALTGSAFAAPAPPPPSRDDPISYEDPENPDNPGGTDEPGGTDNPEEPDPGTEIPETNGIAVLSQPQATISVDSSVTLVGTASPEGARITWATDRPDIVKLSNTRGTDNTVTGVSPGVAYVSARVGNGTAAVCVVTVSGVTLSSTAMELEVNHSEGLRYQIFGDANNVAAWDWSSSNTRVANIVPQGTQDNAAAQVQALEEGVSLITIRGGGYSANCQVTVTREKVDTIHGTLSGGMMKFSTLVSTLQERCRTVTGDELRYVTEIAVPTAPGTLYDGYVSEADTGLGVAKVRDYYVTGGAYLLSNITFVPRASTTGTVAIDYVGVSETGKTFVGKIEVEVTQQHATLAYASRDNAPIHFRADDFSEYGMSVTNRALQYVTFALPRSTYGTLYYNYTSPQVYEGTVAASTRYYMTTNPSLNNVAFVPNPSYAGGDFSLDFTGVDAEGKSFTGKVRITVTNLAETGTVSDKFSLNTGERTSLRNTDFDDDDRTPTYIWFPDLPAASRGVLYYNTSTRVQEDERYYWSSSGSRRLIRDLSFVAGSWTGTLTIPYKGYDGDGEYDGKLVFQLNGSSGSRSSASNATYYTAGPAVALRSTDFTSRALGELDEVATVRLTNPSADAGRLVRNFISPGAYAAFNTAQDYSPEVLNQVYFLPKAGFSGTTTMAYTAKDKKGKVYSSNVTIEVSPPTSSAYFYDLAGRTWAIPAVDFFRTYGILMGAAPTTYDPDAPARRGQFVAVLGRMYSFPAYPLDTVTFADITNPDMYYTRYVTSARVLGIVDKAEYFYPDAPITRQDAALYLYRSMKRAGVAQEGNESDLAKFTDLNLLDAGARQAMASMVRLGVFLGDESGRLNPTGALSRLQMAAILYRAVTTVDTNTASGGGSTAVTTPGSDGLHTVYAKKDATFALNTNTLFFHLPDCKEVKNIPAADLRYVDSVRDKVMSEGCRPCPVCNP